MFDEKNHIVHDPDTCTTILVTKEYPSPEFVQRIMDAGWQEILLNFGAHQGRIFCRRTVDRIDVFSSRILFLIAAARAAQQRRLGVAYHPWIFKPTKPLIGTAVGQSFFPNDRVRNEYELLWTKTARLNKFAETIFEDNEIPEPPARTPWVRVQEIKIFLDQVIVDDIDEKAWTVGDFLEAAKDVIEGSRDGKTFTFQVDPEYSPIYEKGMERVYGSPMSKTKGLVLINRGEQCVLSFCYS